MNSITEKHRVLIAGIGGASLGTEVLKCIVLANRYTIFGCDISPFAYGHYLPDFESTFLACRQGYVESIIDICKKTSIDCIIPGGEEPLVLLSGSSKELSNEGIQLAANPFSLIKNFTDKKITFKILANLGFLTPLTFDIRNPQDISQMTYPCIIKPATGSGGSSFVSLAQNEEEARGYIDYLAKNGKNAIVQEYIPETEGEFTVGVLSLPNGQLVGSIALKRIFDSKLSVLSRGKLGLISTGYTQGLIDHFPDVCTTAENIALAIGSKGPINIQGRVKNGVFIPFEINPRFSASTYLRAMAGFNEIDLYLQYILDGVQPATPKIRPGYYLRSFTETFVGRDEIKK